MARNLQLYDQSKHSVIVNEAENGEFSRFLKDFADGDDVISIEPMGDRVSITQGFDKSSISFSSVDGGSMTIKLKPTSPDVGFLNNLYNLQRTPSRKLVDVTITDGVDDVTVLFGCGITKDSRNTGGPAMQSETFTFVGQKLNLDPSEG